MLEKLLPDVSSNSITTALFIVFSWREIFVDVNGTDDLSVLKEFSCLVQQNKIRYPWLFGRELYDAFFESFSVSPEELDVEQTSKLLDQTPRGVFQAGSLVVGPFGVLVSRQNRSILPVLNPALWHCSDPACDFVHRVKLASPLLEFGGAIGMLIEMLGRFEGEPTNFGRVFSGNDSISDYYDRNKIPNLHHLLGDCFDLKEASAVLGELVNAHQSDFRQRLKGVGRAIRINGPSSQIADRTNRAEALQIALLGEDRDIIHAIESALDKGTISIPEFEIRSPEMIWAPDGNFWVGDCSCNASGVRAAYRNYDQRYARLKTLILDLSSDQDDRSDIEYRLRHTRGESVGEKIENYCLSSDPARAMELVLRSGAKWRKCSELLGVNHPKNSLTSDDEHRLLSRYLWRLGFDRTRPISAASQTKRRLLRLEEQLRKAHADPESREEAIRGAAVNLFAELESYLTRCLAYASWTLLSDHYAETSFRYDEETAYERLLDIVNGFSRDNEEPLSLDAEAKNTLYPICLGFTALETICLNALSSPDEYKRSEADIPEFGTHLPRDAFPFRHELILLDIERGDAQQYVAFLGSILPRLSSIDLFSVRNRCSHGNNSLPDDAELANLIDGLRSMIDDIEDQGISPDVYVRSVSRKDTYDRLRVQYVSELGKEIEVSDTDAIAIPRMPSCGPTIMLSGRLRLSETSFVLKFDYEPVSSYFRTWLNYPRRKSKPLSEPDERCSAESDRSAQPG